MRKMTGLWLCAALLLVGTGSSIAQIPEVVPGWSSAQFEGSEGDPIRGRSVAETECASCHGPDGNSPHPEYPKLAGQNPAYLYWQLWAYKTATRTSNVMSRIAAILSDADAADTASFYGGQTIRPDSVKNAALASTGQRIFFGGFRFAMVPPCAMCHGSAPEQGMPMGGMPMMGNGMMGMMNRGGMMGRRMMTNVPNLNGQHADYIINELNRFADGERQGTVMNRIASGLTEADEKAVGEFLSGVP
jgi:cytochrome c553